jgi:hypothetical protein
MKYNEISPLPERERPARRRRPVLSEVEWMRVTKLVLTDCTVFIFCGEYAMFMADSREKPARHLIRGGNQPSWSFPRKRESRRRGGVSFSPFGNRETLAAAKEMDFLATMLEARVAGCLSRGSRRNGGDKSEGEKCDKLPPFYLL